MATAIAKMNIMLGGNTAPLEASLDRAGSKLGVFGGNIGSLGGIAGGVATAVAAVGAAILAVGAAAATGVVAAASYAVKLAADAEQAKVSFTVMLGSTEKATKLMGQISGFAAATPFQTTELIDASKKLLAFGVDAQQIIPTMRTLGDVAAGLNIPIGELSELYGKARVSGRLMAEDVNQLVGRGIPVIQEFAKQFGVTEGEVKKLVESGKVNFSHLQVALQSLTGEGGKFAGLMEAQSQTLAGKFSTLSDTIEIAMTKAGGAIMEKLDLKSAIDGVSVAFGAMFDAFAPVLDSLLSGLVGVGVEGKNAGSFIITAFEVCAKAVAYVWDGVQILMGGFQLFRATAVLSVAGVIKAVDLVGSAFVKVANLLGANMKWDSTFGDMANAMYQEAGEITDKGMKQIAQGAKFESAGQVGKFFDDVRARADAAAKATTAVKVEALTIEKTLAKPDPKITATLDDIRKKTADLYKTQAQIEDDKTAAQLKGLGASDEQIAQARALTDEYERQKKALDEQKALKDDALKLAEDLLTPEQKATKEIERYKQMLDAGLITKDQFDKASAKARGGKGDSKPAEGPAFVDAGSQAAAAMVYDIQNGLKLDDDTPKQSLDVQQRTLAVMTSIDRKTKANTGGTAEDFYDW